jgi:hypothetical protein
MAPALLTSLLVLSFGGEDDEQRAEVMESAFERDGADWSPLVHVSISAGAIGVGAGNPKDHGLLVSAGVPLYLGNRWPHSQFVLDTHFSASIGLASARLFFIVTPTVGMNWYFFGWLGCEFRGGIGLGARWTSVSAGAGIGYVVETALVIRPSSDDHLRIKLGAMGQEILALAPEYAAALTLVGGVGFEMRI